MHKIGALRYESSEILDLLCLQMSQFVRVARLFNFIQTALLHRTLLNLFDCQCTRMKVSECYITFVCSSNTDEKVFFRSAACMYKAFNKWDGRRWFTHISSRCHLRYPIWRG